MESLCGALTETYNTNVLNTASPLTQAVFIDESRKRKGDEEGRKTLMELILNHRAAKMPEPGLIGGPFTLSLHRSKKDKKIIYIFGESHANEMDCELFARRKTDAELRDGCPEGKIRNPNSGICVKKTGLIGKMIIRENNTKAGGVAVGVSMPIEDFLVDMLKTTDVFLDIFLEVPAYLGVGYLEKARRYLAPGRIQRVLTMLGDCIEKKSRDSIKCQLGRVHYTDIRKLEHGPIGQVSDFRRTWCREVERSTRATMYDRIRDFSKESRLAKVLSALGEGTDEEYLAFWREQIFENQFVKKELDRSYMRKEITAFALETVDREAMEQRSAFILLYDQAERALDEIKEIKEKQSWKDSLLNPYGITSSERSARARYVDAMEGIYRRTVGVNSSMVDIYTLSRIFKVFSGKHDDAPNEPRNIILYYGNAHADRVRKFLKSQGYEMIEAIESPLHIKNCVNVGNFPTPFFNLPVGSE
jgi:hypothetical protein